MAQDTIRLDNTNGVPKRSGISRSWILLTVVLLILLSWALWTRYRYSADRKLIYGLQQADNAMVRQALIMGANPNLGIGRNGNGSRGIVNQIRNMFSGNRDSNRAGRTVLMRATTVSNISAVKDLLEFGADVNYRSPSGSTALLIAASRPNAQVLKLLLDHGANPNVLSSTHQSPLILAAQFAQPDSLQVLLNANADICLRDDDGMSAIMYAVELRRPEIVVCLTNQKTVAQLEDILTEPIVWAAGNNSELLIDKLWITEPDFKRKAQVSRCLCYAARNGNTKLVDLFLSVGGDVNYANRINSPLLMAIEGGFPKVVRQLLSAHANPNQVDQDGVPPLFRAALARESDTMKALVDAKANTKFVRSVSGKSLIHYAVNNISTLQYAISLGADVNSRDKDGNTPLHFVNNASCSEFLLNHGANPNLANNKKVTPLMHAVEASYYGVVASLMLHGANLDAKDDLGQSAIQYRRSNSSTYLTSLLNGKQDLNKVIATYSKSGVVMEMESYVPPAVVKAEFKPDKRPANFKMTKPVQNFAGNPPLNFRPDTRD